jgi:hypothetical protein
MIRAPATGMRISHHPRWFPAGETIRSLQRPKKNRLVKNPISFSKANATNALTRPIHTAIPEIAITLGVEVKSPSLFCMSSLVAHQDRLQGRQCTACTAEFGAMVEG